MKSKPKVDLSARHGNLQAKHRLLAQRHARLLDLIEQLKRVDEGSNIKLRNWPLEDHYEQLNFVADLADQMFTELELLARQVLEALSKEQHSRKKGI